VLDRLRKKNLHQWLPDYARHLVRRARSPRPSGTRHVLFALCDHYEPLHGHATDDVGVARVDAWADGYPKLAAEFRDSDGRPPRHGFFFPGEEYRPHFLDQLAKLAKAGFGEVEFHLHHDGDTAATLAPRITQHLDTFTKHGHISKLNGKHRWAFIHGNWSLANSRPDGKWCGVDDELPMLHELGCYVDLTFPSAPDPCQPDKVDQIYWPTGDLTQRKSFQHGERARVGAHFDDRLLMITGPLSLKIEGGRRLRLENGAITGDDPPTAARVKTWVNQAIHVDGRPEWVFVKVHTHGAIEHTAASLLGDGGRALHRALAAYKSNGSRLHYVTAREMYNVARAAMDGMAGDPNQYFDYAIAPPAIATR
jgi:hypothetical protein